MRLFLRTSMLAFFVAGTTAAEGPKPVSDSKLMDFVARRVRQIQPLREERRIDEIGWAQSFIAAKLLAASERRPVFLFTHDGKVATGRC